MVGRRVLHGDRAVQAALLGGLACVREQHLLVLVADGHRGRRRRAEHDVADDAQPDRDDTHAGQDQARITFRFRQPGVGGLDGFGHLLVLARRERVGGEGCDRGAGVKAALARLEARDLLAQRGEFATDLVLARRDALASLPREVLELFGDRSRNPRLSQVRFALLENAPQVAPAQRLALRFDLRHPRVDALRLGRQRLGPRKLLGPLAQVALNLPQSLDHALRVARLHRRVGGLQPALHALGRLARRTLLLGTRTGLDGLGPPPRPGQVPRHLRQQVGHALEVPSLQRLFRRGQRLEHRASALQRVAQLAAFGQHGFVRKARRLHRPDALLGLRQLALVGAKPRLDQQLADLGRFLLDERVTATLDLAQPRRDPLDQLGRILGRVFLQAQQRLHGLVVLVLGDVGIGPLDPLLGGLGRLATVQQFAGPLLRGRVELRAPHGPFEQFAAAGEVQLAPLLLGRVDRFERRLQGGGGGVRLGPVTPRLQLDQLLLQHRRKPRNVAAGLSRLSHRDEVALAEQLLGRAPHLRPGPQRLELLGDAVAPFRQRLGQRADVGQPVQQTPHARLVGALERRLRLLELLHEARLVGAGVVDVLPQQARLFSDRVRERRVAQDQVEPLRCQVQLARAAIDRRLAQLGQQLRLALHRGLDVGGDLARLVAQRGRDPLLRRDQLHVLFGLLDRAAQQRIAGHVEVVAHQLGHGLVHDLLELLRLPPLGGDLGPQPLVHVGRGLDLTQDATRAFDVLHVQQLLRVFQTPRQLRAQRDDFLLRFDDPDVLGQVRAPQRR